MIDKNALLALADEMCRRMTGGNGNPAPDPVYGAELLEWAERIRALAAQAPAADSEAVDGWRVLPFTGSWKTRDERWEVYDPNGNGGAIYESDIGATVVRQLLDALAKQAAQESD